jgi:hypothetical protein
LGQPRRAKVRAQVAAASVFGVSVAFLLAADMD